MADERSPDPRAIILRPLLVWMGLFGLGVVSLGYALWPGAPLKPMLSLAIVVVQASLVLGAYMNLGKASVLVRMTALIGVVWLSFLFLMAFADLATR
jgi:caa(3)-type oxidase subunit IV